MSNDHSRIVLVMLVRNEADVIASTLRWHLANGVDHAVVTDHMSTDATPDILSEFVRAGQLTLLRHDGLYEQAKLTTQMAEVARDQCGAHWVLPVDADELWTYAHGSLRDALNACPYDVVRMRTVNFIPTQLDDVTEPDPVLRMQYAVPSPPKIPYLPYVLKKSQSKVLFRAAGLRQIFLGNHDVEHTSANRGSLDGTAIHHYPLRSREQFFRKVMEGGAALEANPNLAANAGYHWRRWYALYKADRLEQEWRRLSFGRLRLGALRTFGVVQRDQAFGQRYLAALRA